MSGVEATVSRLAALYDAADPRIACALVEANVLLVLADLRGSTNFLIFEPTDADRAAIERLGETLDTLSLRAKMVEERRNANRRMCSAVVLESLAGYAYISTHTQMRGMSPFDAATGWTGWHSWAGRVMAALRAAYPADTEDIFYHRWIGLALGYPDQAIEDACQWIREGREWDTLADADLPSVARYKGAQPVFSFAPMHSNDPGIVDTIATWNALLEGVYASVWHQQLRDDPTFQAARHEREEQRRWPMNTQRS